jgi:FMN phosphatase YigB (HAD superfamily)
MTRVLLTDVDNTLFSWIDYFGPCFRALVHAVARAAGFDEESLYMSFKLVFQDEGTVEIREAIQNSALVQTLPENERQRLAHIGFVAFGQAMRKRLRPYDGVVRTLRLLRSDGVRVVAVTNSGILHAVDRLRRLGLAKLLDGLVAWDHDVSGRARNAEEYQALVSARIHRSGLPWVVPLRREELKPNVSAYDRALRKLGVSAGSTWILGDSVEKDLVGAAELGATSVWAKYGLRYDPVNFATLLRITHWSQEKIDRTYHAASINPDYVLEEFSAIRELIRPNQAELF